MKILIFNRTNELTEILKNSLSSKYNILFVDTLYQIKEHVIRNNVDLILMEIIEKDDYNSGRDILRILNFSGIDIPIILIADKSDVSIAVEFVKLGAADYIEKTSGLNLVAEKITYAIDKLNKYSGKELPKNSAIADWKVLFVDDNVDFTKSIKFNFSKKYNVEIVNDFIDAREVIKDNEYNCIFLDIKDETRNDDKAGVTLLEYVMNVNRNIPVVMLSGWADTSIAVECLKLGANDFLEKSLKIMETIDRTGQTIEKIYNKKNEDSNFEKAINTPSYRLIDIIGESDVIKNIRNEIIEIANHDVPVLIYGDTGTGKEMVASAIHIASTRRENNFIELDCGTIPETIFESELFGSTKGAFTGAVNDRMGKMELANNGTLFLDEIENLTLEQQAKLLRVIEDKKIYPLGSNEGKIIDFRLVCATNVDLYKLVEDGKFREDLFYRLNVYRVELPPLRERGEGDISLLINHFLTRNYNIEKEAEELLQKYSWPGNVRELKNLIKKLEIITRSHNGSLITCEIVKEGFSEYKNNDRIKQTLCDLLEYYNLNVPSMIRDFEDLAVIESYKDLNSNISKVAQKVYSENPEDNRNHREKVRKVLERNKHLLS